MREIESPVAAAAAAAAVGGFQEPPAEVAYAR